jgi:Cu(I)/Ag(I) efflux system membrane fusion protein
LDDRQGQENVEGTGKMRRISIAIAVIAAIAASYALGRFITASKTDTQMDPKVLYYVDPMHPAYTSDKPGIAPDCGMKLVPVYFQGSGNAATSLAGQLPDGAVSVDGATQRLLGIKTAAVEKSGTTVTIHGVGRVVPEDTRVFSVNSGLDGFIRATYNDSVGMRVRKDQKLATYYSPDFLAVASGFLAASERVPGSVGNDGSRTVPFPGTVSKQGVSSLQGYTDRLRNLGMSDMQIKEMADSRQLPQSIDVVAPADGFVLSRNISAGQHFDHNMEFYRIADLSKVWVLGEINEQDAGYLHPGGMAEIVLKGEGRRLPARISDSLPQSEAGGGTVKVRLEVENPTFLLRPEMLIDVEVPVRLPAAATVPVDALVDTGERARVYVQQSEGVFEPRAVVPGRRFGERVEILRGLQLGDRVVVQATFLLDSESRLKAQASVSLPAPSPKANTPVSTQEHVMVGMR